MVGYEMLTVSGTTYTITTIAVLGAAVMLGFLFNEFHGYMGGNEWGGNAWNKDVPIVKYVRTATGFKTIVTKAPRKDYSSNFDYTWKWVESEREMGWCMKEPPAEVCTFMSAGMADAVNKMKEKGTINP